MNPHSIDYAVHLSTLYTKENVSRLLQAAYSINLSLDNRYYFKDNTGSSVHQSIHFVVGCWNVVVAVST